MIKSAGLTGKTFDMIDKAIGAKKKKREAFFAGVGVISIGVKVRKKDKT